MFEIALLAPEIPPNTGNIIRLCANTGARLHLIEPLGFHLDDRRLRRAGLDYHDLAAIGRHATLDACRAALADRRWFGFSTRARRPFWDARFAPGDVLLFGSETRGLPDAACAALGADCLLRIPMRPGSRSLNLANAVAIALYEALRQCAAFGAGY